MTQREIDKILKGLDSDTQHEMKYCFSVLESLALTLQKTEKKSLKLVKK